MGPSTPARAAALGVCLGTAALCFAACGNKGSQHKGAHSASAEAPQTKEILGGKEFCDLVFAQTKKKLEAGCKGQSTERLAEANDKCLTLLDASVEAGAVTIDKAAGQACAEKVVAAWMDGAPMRAAIDLAAYGCGGLFEGKVKEGEGCRTSIECAAPLVCKGPDGVDKPKEGKCTKPAAAGAKCFSNDDALVFSGRSECDDDSYCPGEARPRKLDNMWGAGDDFGFGGLGLSGAGRGGGRGEGIGLGNIGTIGHGAGTGQGVGGGGGRLGSGHRADAPRVRMGATSVSGRLPPEVIQRIVRQNFGRFRLCYENGLKKKPDLEGCVFVRFVIAKDGSVSSAGSAGSDLPDAGVVACVTKAFHGLSFPQPEGGIVTVVYPIMFSPGG